MGVRWPWAEHGGAQGPPGPCTAKPMSRALTLLGERATYQSRAQRAADLILGQTPRRAAPTATGLPEGAEDPVQVPEGVMIKMTHAL